MVSSLKLPILKKGEYILWTMKMEQYLAHTDYALWEVILNEGLNKGYDRFQRLLSLFEIHRAGIAEQPRIQEAGVEMLGIQGTEEEIMEKATDFALMAFTSNPSSSSRSNSEQALKNKGIVDSGCSRHMTGNKAYFTDYQEINNGGFVAFGSSREGKAAQRHLALVTKPHNKTPYELLNGRLPSKAFRVFNTKTRIVEENLHSKDDSGSKTVVESVKKEDQAYRDELDRLTSLEKEASDAVDSFSKEFEQGCMDQRGAAKVGSTNSFNTVSNLVNAVSTSGTFSAGGPSSSHHDAFIPDDMLLYMDVKSAFLYGIIEDEVYVSQPPGFIDLQFPKKVYKVEKALYGLHQALKAWKIPSVRTASTPIETQKPLVKDKEAANVDVHLYRSMIRSLMYLTTSRPDRMFAVCACSRFQVTPKLSYLHAVK
uniref:Uncharacterized mitochondrial protein AtMg00810-like n=1 Tax=Tanacetum cinerariifolium TaxID=118510 RepID=A0A699IAD7_TANCI|nr:uncharacterized mitochondrial protein AtMg00810-like [Tanacetum cinerariifolium]